ncbi:hypothetical protein OAA78_04830 [Flavobacteriaceae bacterium]|nr:hypothetical protein [Flavobacteriaceae bacterium]MDC1491840.1 hypothetical protein [Flavobacteriaceae bacterium]
MKNTLIIFFLSLITLSCSKDESVDLIPQNSYNPELSVEQNLNNGVDVLDILEMNDTNSLYGIEYNGGYIFHVNSQDGSLIVATDYSQIGSVAWGDVFSLDTNTEIGSGDQNTQIIVQGNENDNSVDGFEFGSDNYAFKIVTDLDYNNNNDWFIPSRDSMQAIYDNVHSLGFGNFDESLIYWSSTKQGYSPSVMGFSFESWGGEPFLGSCASPNGILIARIVN